MKLYSILDHAKFITSGTTSNANVSYAFTIIGNVPSLKNSRPIYISRTSRKPLSARSDEMKAYIRDFCLQVPPHYRDLSLGGRDKPLRTNITVYYQSYRSDLDLAIVYDCLQHSGVVHNDRAIREKHERAEIDPDNPRVEIQIQEI